MFVITSSKKIFLFTVMVYLLIADKTFYGLFLNITVYFLWTNRREIIKVYDILTNYHHVKNGNTCYICYDVTFLLNRFDKKERTSTCKFCTFTCCYICYFKYYSKNNLCPLCRRESD